jgi:hypothetical protein
VYIFHGRSSEVNQFFESLALAVLIACVLVLSFLFDGDPDLWDKWHDQAMKMECRP